MRRQIREGTVTLKHLMTIRKAGKVYRYVRLPSGLVKMPDAPPDSPVFLAAYAAAMQATPKATRAQTGTIAAMVEAFLRSDLYLSKSPAYRRVLRREAEAIREQADDAMAKHLKPGHIEADLLPLAANKSKARLKAWRAVCGFGRQAGLIPSDPSLGVKAKRAPKTAGYLPWSDDEVDAFRVRWPIGTVPRACMELLAWTGARVSDAVMIGRGMIGRDGVLSFRQEKTGELAYVPWSCALPRYADPSERDLMLAAIAGQAGHMTFLATQQGRARSHKALSTLISDSARAAGVTKSAHGLRKRRAVKLIEGGASVSEACSWTGHRTLAEIQHYSDEWDRRSAAIGTEQARNNANPDKPTANRIAK